ncbi:MAG TPA: hypothetical protein VE957_08170 [Terriglobales bacterium]|nr:hypothetical protein [Terriglobales bacterium]
MTDNYLAIGPPPIGTLLQHPQGDHNINMGGIWCMVGRDNCLGLFRAVLFVDQVHDIDPFLAPLDAHDWLVRVGQNRRFGSGDSLEYGIHIFRLGPEGRRAINGRDVYNRFAYFPFKQVLQWINERAAGYDEVVREAAEEPAGLKISVISQVESSEFGTIRNDRRPVTAEKGRSRKT